MEAGYSYCYFVSFSLLAMVLAKLLLAKRDVLNSSSTTGFFPSAMKFSSLFDLKLHNQSATSRLGIIGVRMHINMLNSNIYFLPPVNGSAIYTMCQALFLTNWLWTHALSFGNDKSGSYYLITEHQVAVYGIVDATNDVHGYCICPIMQHRSYVV